MEEPMKLTSVIIVAVLLGAPCAAGAGPPNHPDLSLPQAQPQSEEPIELEPIEVTGKANPMDLAIDRAKLLVDLRCKLCKDADFSVKGVALDRFETMFLAPANDLTQNAQIVLYSRCANNPGLYASCRSATSRKAK
jgi:hypothetical protein